MTTAIRTPSGFTDYPGECRRRLISRDDHCCYAPVFYFVFRPRAVEIACPPRQDYLQTSWWPGLKSAAGVYSSFSDANVFTHLAGLAIADTVLLFGFGTARLRFQPVVLQAWAVDVAFEAKPEPPTNHLSVITT
jgi:hypothetical protein